MLGAPTLRPARHNEGGTRTDTSTGSRPLAAVDGRTVLWW